ncbi:MAG: hypothetical protein ABSA11_16210 [Candidatus Bathyarchaeia archaeon]
MREAQAQRPEKAGHQRDGNAAAAGNHLRLYSQENTGTGCPLLDATHQAGISATP